MKNLLLCTAFSFVFVSPAFAGDVPVDGDSHHEEVIEDVLGVDDVIADGVEAESEVEAGVEVEVETGVKTGVETGVEAEAEAEAEVIAPAEVAVEVVVDAVSDVAEEVTVEVVIEVDESAVSTEALEVEAESEVEAVIEVEVEVEVEAEEEIVAPVEVVVEAVVEEVLPLEDVEWGYTGRGAAPYWAELDPEYAVCGSGQNQSPVNIIEYEQSIMPQISYEYEPTNFQVVNTGHGLQVENLSGGFRADHVSYELQQIHFHTPSEHYLDGSPYAMELHLVHKASDGALAVIGVMMKLGAHNDAIQKIWSNAPLNAGDRKAVSQEVSAQDFLPALLGYYRYDGSLTTPPCTEGVRWHVLKNHIEISPTQLQAFQALYPVNARPVQPLNGRVVKGD